VIELSPALLSDLPAMQAMASYYVYDMSEFLGSLPGWEFPETGTYECDDLRPYFVDAGAHPFFIRVAGEIAGFALVNSAGTDSAVEFNMAQFFVLRKFKGRGVGRQAATTCFSMYPGLWEVLVIPGNVGAYAFWKQIVRSFTGGKFEESRRRVRHLSNSEQDVFRFSSDLPGSST
jgi:ribosomal-protein-alanine N-acetyltransferase